MSEKLKVLAVVPVRSGSKGIPRKNIATLNGEPLMSYAIRTAHAAEKVDRVIVSTDTREFADVAGACGAEAPFLRPANLSDDKTMLIHVVAHALKFFDEVREHYDAVLSVHATAPLIRACTLDAMVEKMESTGCDAVATASEIRHGHPYLAQVLSGIDGDEANPFLRLDPDQRRYPRQVRPKLYAYSGGAFLRRRHLLEHPDVHTNALGPHPRVVLVDATESTNIDDPIDLLTAEYLLRARL